MHSHLTARATVLSLLLTLLSAIASSSAGAQQAPQINWLSPRYVAAGSSFTLSVHGTALTRNTTLYWNSTPLPTTFQSSTYLTAAVSASVNAPAGTSIITPDDNPGNGQLKVTAFPAVKTFTIVPSSVIGTFSARGYLTFNVPAAKGVKIGLGANNPQVVSTPSYVSLPPGQSSATFKVTTYPVSAKSTIFVYARVALGLAPSAGGTQTITVRPISVESVVISPSSVKGGTQSMGTVTLQAPAGPSSITVNLVSSNPSAASPAVKSIVIPKGSTTGSFAINTSPVNSSTKAWISASANGDHKTALLTVTP